MNAELLVLLVNGGVTLITAAAGVRFGLNLVLREVNRAHRRLDAIGAPACTEERPLQI